MYKRLSITEESWNGSQWVPGFNDFRRLYEYDYEGNLARFTRQVSQDGWQNSYDFIYYYEVFVITKEPARLDKAVVEIYPNPSDGIFFVRLKQPPYNTSRLPF